MHRFVVSPIQDCALPVVFSAEETHHAVKVLRLQNGEPIEISDGTSRFSACLQLTDTQQAMATNLQPLPSHEPSVEMVLWQGLPKGDKLEWITQKATELGVHSIWSVAMERSISKLEKDDKRKVKKQERYERIALEASKQCCRAHVPIIAPQCTFKEALTRIDASFDAIFVAWEEEHTLLLSQALTQLPSKPTKIVLVIGPEGGITEEEWCALQKLGAQSVSLGKRILRTETAGLCALSVVLTNFGEI